MWILPKSLISASVVDTEELTLDCDALSQICAQSLMQRSKPSRSSFFSREWKAGRLMRLQSGAISSPSRGQRFLDAWTSSLAVIPASHSAQPVSDSEQTTSDTSGQPLQLAFGFCDQESVSLRTSKGTSALGYGKSSMSWEQWVTERRGEYSARLKSALRTRESGCSSWPTAKARDWKDTMGCSLDAVNPDGTHRNRRDRLVGAIAAEMSGPAAPVNPSTHGSRQESLATTGKLNPRWVETLMGLPVGWTMVSCSHPIVFNASVAMMSSAGNVEVTTRTVHAQGQTAVMTDNRTDELRMLGNGVVPATAARAFVTLMEELL